MTPWILGIGIVGLWLLAGGLIAVLLGIAGALADLQQGPSELGARVSELEAKLRGMQREIEALPTIWKDEADRAVKAEKRAAYHARRAEELRAEGGGELELESVPARDGAAGGDQGVPAMRPVLVSDQSEDERLHEIRRRVALGF